METVRRHIRPIGFLSLVLLLLQIMGCASFAPLEENQSAGDQANFDARVRVQTRDNLRYIFPSGQCTLKYGQDSTLVAVKGWGDKYSAFGLIDRGYFELTRDQIKEVEIDKLGANQIALIAGAVVGLSVLTYFGVKAVGGDAGSGGGRVEGPAQGN
jgi:hypothetical protein